MKKVLFSVMFLLLTWANLNAQCTGLTIIQNPSFTNQTITNSQSNMHLASYFLQNPTNDTINTTTLYFGILQNSSSIPLGSINGLIVYYPGVSGIELLLYSPYANGLFIPMQLLPGATKNIEIYTNNGVSSFGTIQTTLNYSGFGLHSGIIYPTCPSGSTQANSAGQIITVGVPTPPPIANFTVDTAEICSGGVVHVTNLSTFNTGLTYVWYINGANPNSWNGYNLNQDIVFYNQTNTNQISLQIYDSASNNILASKSIYITVWPSPSNIQTTPSNPTLGCGNSPVAINATGANTDYFLWKNFAGDTLSTNSNLIATHSGQYYLVVKNIYGCTNQWDYCTYVQSHPGMNPQILLNGGQVMATPSTGQTVDTLTTCENQNGYQLWLNVNYSADKVFWDDGTSNNYRHVSQTGKYFVKVQDNYNCWETDTVYLKTTPLPQAIINGDLNFCQNSSTTLSLNSGPGYTYFWNNGGLTSQNISINWTGVVYGSVTDSLGCRSEANPVQTKMILSPDAGISTYDCYIIVATPTTGDKYQWYLNNSILIGDTNGFYEAHGPGFYRLEVTNTGGCKSSSQNMWLNCTPTGILINETTSEKIYPNPFTDNLNIEFADDENHRVILYDIIGKEIFQTSGKNILSIENDNLSSGLYFIKIDSREKLEKVIKK